VAVNEDLAVFLLDRQELVARALTQRFRRLVGLVRMLRFRRQRDRGHYGHSCLDPRLPQWREQSHFVDRVQADTRSDVAQEALGRLDHAVAFVA
jgi:hypothetical protein